MMLRVFHEIEIETEDLKDRIRGLESQNAALRAELAEQRRKNEEVFDDYLDWRRKAKEAKADMWSGHVYPDTNYLSIDVAVPLRRTLDQCRQAAEHIIASGKSYQPERFENPGYECGLNCEPKRNPDGTVKPDALMVCEDTYGTPGTGDHSPTR